MKKLTTEQFIIKAREIHGNKYDYSLANYLNNKSKIKIICPTHGEFIQTPNAHLNKQGCPSCGKDKSITERAKTTEQFIQEAKQVHGDKYDYSLVNYKNHCSKIKIICPIHGAFEQIPNSHIQGFGCQKCGLKKTTKLKTLTKEQFIQKAKELNNSYDYSLVEYINNSTKVKIICKEHGVFEITPNNLLSKHGCQKCKTEKIKKYLSSTTKQFVKKAEKIYGNKYDYSLVEYINAHTAVKIICKEHGVFEITPNNHLNCRGCPSCTSSSLELITESFLKENNIHFKAQYVFENLKDKKYLRYDFYLPEKNLLIELNGKQHYEWIPFFHKTRKDFLLQKHHDWLKRKFARDNGLKLVVIPYHENIISALKANLELIS